MKLSIGIVGLPNVGKSTLFKILSKNDILIANYPFATIDPNVGVVPVPDERVDVLAKMSNSKKKIPAVVEFYDIAGLVKGAAQGQGLGNKFLAHIREVNAIVVVLRCFGGHEIIHVENSVDPIRDMETINMELALKDLETVEKRLPKAEADMRGTIKGAKEEVDALKQLAKLLNATPQHYDIIANVVMLGGVKDLNLLSAKPKIYLLNGRPEDVPPVLLKKIKEEGSEYVISDLRAVSEIPGLIKKAYEILGLISFFTTGEDETRAWTIRRGAKAPEAAGAIHTDFEKNFIRAEVVSYYDFIECNGWSGAKQKGKLRVEGKDYVVKDGDIMVIRHG